MEGKRTDLCILYDYLLLYPLSPPQEPVTFSEKWYSWLHQMQLESRYDTIMIYFFLKRSKENVKWLT